MHSVICFIYLSVWFTSNLECNVAVCLPPNRFEYYTKASQIEYCIQASKVVVTAVLVVVFGCGCVSA